MTPKARRMTPEARRMTPKARRMMPKARRMNPASDTPNLLKQVALHQAVNSFMATARCKRFDGPAARR